MKRESVERKGVINAELIDEYSEKTCIEYDFFDGEN